MGTAVDQSLAVVDEERAARQRIVTIAGVVLFLAVLLTTLAWAKWIPYAHKIPATAASGRLGASILSGGQAAPPAPSIQAAISYALTYLGALWPALVAGLTIAAALEAFLPPALLWRLLASRAWGSAAIRGGICSMGSMMCTCCAAPIAVTMRKRGIPAAAAAAFWIGNPALNPAVLAFLVVVLSWQWAVLRVVSAIALLAIVGLVAHRMLGASSDVTEATAAAPTDQPTTIAEAVVRFLRTLARLCVTLLPEYLAIVLLLGAFRGWLFPAGQELAAWGVLAILLFALVGMLFVIPTAAEIPIVQGFLIAGLPIGPAAALMITLPAVSLPSLVMVARSFSVRTTLAFAGLVVLIGVLAGLAAPLFGL
jgi:uncharacterized membrane protein YraQ (UPF0718 family)